MSNEEWHLDKKVSLTIIFLIVVQFGASVAAWTSMREQVLDHEKRISMRDGMRISERLALLESAAVDQRVRDERQDLERKEALVLVREELRALRSDLKLSGR